MRHRKWDTNYQKMLFDLSTILSALSQIFETLPKYVSSEETNKRERGKRRHITNNKYHLSMYSRHSSAIWNWDTVVSDYWSANSSEPPPSNPTPTSFRSFVHSHGASADHTTEDPQLRKTKSAAGGWSLFVELWFWLWSTGIGRT